jgi:hypothetical protein
VVPGREMATGGTRRRHVKEGSEFNAGALTVSILLACITAKCCASPPLSRGIDPSTLASEERDELQFVYNRTNVSVVYNRKFTEWCSASESLSLVLSSDWPANAFPGTAYALPASLNEQLIQMAASSPTGTTLSSTVYPTILVSIEVRRSSGFRERRSAPGAKDTSVVHSECPERSSDPSVAQAPPSDSPGCLAARRQETSRCQQSAHATRRIASRRPPQPARPSRLRPSPGPTHQAGSSCRCAACIPLSTPLPHPRCTVSPKPAACRPR